MYNKINRWLTLILPLTTITAAQPRPFHFIIGMIQYYYIIFIHL